MNIADIGDLIIARNGTYASICVIARCNAKDFTQVILFEFIQTYIKAWACSFSCHNICNTRVVCMHFHCSESRYLLFLTENYAALKILFHYLEDAVMTHSKVKPFILFGSSFPKDNEYTQVYILHYFCSYNDGLAVNIGNALLLRSGAEQLVVVLYVYM